MDEPQPTEQNMIDVLQSLHRGQFLGELAEAWQQALDAHRQYGGKAAIKITFAIKRASDNDPTILEVSAGITKSLPEPKQTSEVLFATNDERLVSKYDPRQPDMFSPRVVPSEPADDAGAGAEEAHG